MESRLITQDSRIFRNTRLMELLQHCPYGLLRKMDLVEFSKAGEFYLEQEEKHEHVYILVAGEIEIYFKSSHGSKVIFDSYDQAGDLIGEQEAVLDQAYSASVTNRTSCLLIKMSNQNFLEWLKSDFYFAQLFIKNQCEQVHHLARETSRYTLVTAREQVAYTLIKLDQKNHQISKSMVQHSIPITNRHVNRILSEFVKEGWITVVSGSIHLQNKDALRAFKEEK